MNLSVYVMDTASGLPAACVRVGLVRVTMSGCTDLARGHTGEDGRLAVWRGPMCGPATFRLELDLDRYFATLGTIPLFPRAVVVLRACDEDLHLTLLISPNLMFTYRASANEPP
jgi:5-hydroxyisourate hydrolase